MASNKFCKRCGAKLEEDSQFCTECGEKLDISTPNISQGSGQQTGNYIPPTYSPSQSSGQNVPYSYNQYNSSAGVTGKKKNHTALIIGIVAGIVLVSVLAFVGLKVLGNRDSKTTSTQTKEPEKKVETKTEPKTETKTETKKVDTSNPMSYLPKLHMKYAFEKVNSEGKTEKVNMVSGRVTDFVILTTVEFPAGADTNTENRFAYRSNHIKKIEKTIDVFSDEQFSYFGKEYIIGKSTKWLPEKIASGADWKDDLASHKITQVGVECDLGFQKLKDCIVIESTGEAGTQVNYIAPEYGTVMIKDKTSGKVMYKLTGAETMSKEEADKIIEHFSIAMSTYVEKYYGK